MFPNKTNFPATESRDTQEIFQFFSLLHSPRLQKEVLVADISCILPDRVFVTGIPVTKRYFYCEFVLTVVSLRLQRACTMRCLPLPGGV